MSSKYVSKVKIELMLLQDNLQPQFTKPAQLLTPIYKYLWVYPQGSVVFTSHQVNFSLKQRPQIKMQSYGVQCQGI